MPGPPLPPISTPSGTASPATPNANSPTDAMLEPILTSLKVIQSQFTAFQQDLGGVKSNVKDALSQLHILRTAHDKANERIAELQDVVGVSTAGVRFSSRGKGGRGQFRGGNAGATTESLLDAEDADIATVPEKTLVQSMASIQSAIEALLRASHSHVPVIRREAVPLLANHFPGQAFQRTPESPPLQSAVNPSKQHLTLQRTQFAYTTSSTSPSESSSPFSSIAIPTPEFATSPQPALSKKEHADASIQACLPSAIPEPSSSTSSSLGPALELTPVDWNVNPAILGRFANNSRRRTAFTAQSLAHLLCDGHHPSAPNTAMDTRPMRDSHHPLRNLTISDTQLSTRTMSALTRPNEVATNSSSTQPAQLTILPTASSSSDNSVVASPGDTTPVTKTPPSPLSISGQSPVFQTPSLTTEGVNSSTKLLTSQLSSLSSIRDTPMSIPGASGPEEQVGCHGRPSARLDREDIQMTSTEGDPISVTGAGRTAAGSAPIVSELRRQSSPVDADDEGLTSSLLTPPLETVIEEREPRVVSCGTHGHGPATDLNPISRARLPRNLAVIPTPPFSALEPSVGEEQGVVSSTGGGGSLGVFSQLQSPLTPSLLSPSSAAGSSFAEEGASHGSWETATHKVVEEHTISPNDARVALVDKDDVSEGVNADAPTDEAQSGPRMDQADVEPSTFAMSVITPMNESQSMAVSNEDTSQVPDVDPHMAPRSRLNVALPEHDQSLSVTGVNPLYSLSINDIGYDFHFSSPCRNLSPPTSSTPSRYTTPFELSDARPPQDIDEDEVWRALMLGGSSVSTPLSGSTPLPMLFSQQLSRASSVHPHPHPHSLRPLSVDPSVLHVREPEPESESLPHVSDVSLSSLTPLGDTDDGANSDAARASKTLRAHVLTDIHKSRGRSGGRRSEPYRTLGESVSVARAAPETFDGVGGLLAGRAVSVRPMGGPNASVDELALLARREPLKICLKIPKWMKGVKRKRDDVDRKGEGESVVIAREDGSAGDEDGDSVDKDPSEGQGDGVSSEVIPPAGTGAMSMPGKHTPTPTASRLTQESPADHADAVEHPDVPVPRKRKKRQSEGVEKEIHAARTVSGVSENLQPSRIGEVTSAPSMSMSSSGVLDSARQHGMTSNLPTSRKRTKKEDEARQKKVQQGLKTKPKSPMKYHFWNGQIVTIASESELRFEEPVTPSAPQPEEANRDTRTPTRTRPRKRQENRAVKIMLCPENSSQPSSRSTRPVKSSSTKEDAWNAITRRDKAWPELPSVFSHWDVQFIQCDNCDKWYHYGCVAIESGDPRLEPGVLFICPTCHNQSARRQTLRNQGDTCARPDCPEPQVTPDSQLFVVEKLVGRKKCDGYVYMWLAKWEGYPMSQATWIPKENVVGDGTRMFNTFLEDAVEEGADISGDVVLLQEALKAGWEG